MGHQNAEVVTSFVELQLASGRTLRMTPDHLVMIATGQPRWGLARALVAGKVVPGMFAFSGGQAAQQADISSRVAVDTVVADMVIAARWVKDRGIYAPVTDSEEAVLLVNGVAAHESNAHYSVGELLFWKKTIAILQRMASLKTFDAAHTWLHAHQFPELFNTMRRGLLATPQSLLLAVFKGAWFSTSTDGNACW